MMIYNWTRPILPYPKYNVCNFYSRKLKVLQLLNKIDYCKCDDKHNK